MGNKINKVAPHDASRSPSPPTNIATAPNKYLRIVFETTDGTMREKSIPKSLLTRHSKLFARLINHKPEVEEVHVGTGITPRAFQNFIDYMHCGIYSVQSPALDYRVIVENSQAYVLGEKMGCWTYCNHAMRQLHSVFLPLARTTLSNSRLSPIKPSDIEYICEHTEGPISPHMGNVRQLFFDAVASHWSQFETTTTYMMCNEDWNEVFHKYPRLAARVANSCELEQRLRFELLSPVDQYLYLELNADGEIKVESLCYKAEQL